MAGKKRPGRYGRVREAAAKGYSPAPTAVAGVVFDSDVIIEILRGRAKVVEQARQLEETALPTYCTPVTVAEIFAGIRPGEEPVTEAFFAARGELMIDSFVGRRAGAYLARYSRSHGVELADALIAAATTVNGLVLWTLNRKHYPMQDLRFYDP